MILETTLISHTFCVSLSQEYYLSELKFIRLHDHFSILISRCRMQTCSTSLSVDMVITVAFRALQKSWNQTTLQLICFQTRAAPIRDSTNHCRRTCSRTQVKNHITLLWKFLNEFNQKTHWLLTWITLLSLSLDFLMLISTFLKMVFI